MAKSIAGIVAGRAYVVLEAIDNTPRVLQKIQANFYRFGSSLQSMGSNMITKGIMGATPAAVSMKIFSDFDDAMRRVEARSSGTADQLRKVREQAMLLGRTTSFTARMIANLQSILAQRGFSLPQVEDMTKPIMNLARAGGSGNRGQDILMAADLVAVALKGYRLEAKDAAAVSDMFTATINNSNFSLEDVAQAMTVASSVANLYETGISGLADSLGTLAAMRDVGVEPSIAGTGFRNLFIKASEAKKRKDFNADLMKATGHTIEFGDAMQNLHRPSSILFAIRDATKDLGTMQQGGLLAKLFGLRAIVPAGALATSEDNYDNMMEKIEMAGGLSQKTADLMDAGIGGSFRILISATEGLAIALGDALAPAIMTINNISTALQIQLAGWISKNKELVTSINMAVVILIPLGAAIFTLGLAFKMLALAMSPFIFAAKILLMPLNIIAALIPIVAGAIGSLISILFSIIAAAITPVIAAFTIFVNVLAVLIPMALIGAGIAIGYLLTVMGFLIGVIGAAVIEFGAMILAIGVFGSGIGSIIVGAAIVTALAGAIMAAVSAMGELIGGFLAWNEKASPVVKRQIEGLSLVDKMVMFVGESYKSFMLTAVAAVERVKQAFQGLLTTVKEVGLGIAGALRAGQFKLAMQIAIEGLKLAFIQLKNFILHIWDIIADKLQTTFEKIATKMAAIMSAIPGMGTIGSRLSKVINEGLSPELTPEQKRRQDLIAAKDHLRKVAELTQKIKLKTLTGQIDPSSDIIEDMKRKMSNALEGLSKIPGVFKVDQDLIRNGLPESSARFAVPQTGVEHKTGEALKSYFQNLIRANSKDDSVQNKQLKVQEDIETNTRNLGGTTTTADVVGV